MAFLSKFGNILKQTNQCSWFFIKSFAFSGHKVVKYGMNEDSLREAFSKYGEVVETRVILDRETGRSRGFGFVTFTNAEEASSAIQALDGHVIFYCR